jgi:hypothetical protein
MAGAQTGGSHLEPDRDKMVDDAESQNKIFVDHSMFMEELSDLRSYNSFK